MIRIGFVDDYLDNWHTNHYPEYLTLASSLYGIEAKVTHVYAKRDTPDEYGMTTKVWCEKYDCISCATYEELIDSVDAIMVMCADNCLPHEELAKKALASGKPVYCDKTFAPSLEAARRMFAIANDANTPVFTCSAQRFCMELLSFQMINSNTVNFCSTTGHGDMVNYSIHQYEMIEAIMGIGAKKCQAFTTKEAVTITYLYEDGRYATFTQAQKLPFRLLASAEDGTVKDLAVTDYYMNFCNKLLHFFQDRICPVKQEDTLEIMALQQAGRAAINNPGVWIEI